MARARHPKSRGNCARNARYTGGILALGNYMGYIEVHNDSGSTLTTVTLLVALPGLSVGNTVAISAGCDRIYPTCIATFNNGPNHFGSPYLSVSDPWTAGIALGPNIKDNPNQPGF